MLAKLVIHETVSDAHFISPEICFLVTVPGFVSICLDGCEFPCVE
jgi:hypothetical protein